MSCGRFALLRRLVSVGALLSAAAVFAEDIPAPGTVTLRSRHAFDTLVSLVEAVVEKNKMGLVAQASASRGARLPAMPCLLTPATVRAGLDWTLAASGP